MSNSENTAKKPKKIKPAGADGHRSRMFDKFLAAGDNNVPTRDIIEMLLYYPIKIRDTRDAAVSLMEKFGSAEKVLSAPRDELAATDGLGEGSATFLRTVGCAMRRLSEEPLDDRKIYSSTTEMSELFYPYRDKLRRDITCIACFDNAMRPIRADKLKDGFFTKCPANANAFIRFVSDHHGCSVTLARISPARSEFPTSEDYAAARYAQRLLSKLDVKLNEYFIISRDEIIELLKLGI